MSNRYMYMRREMNIDSMDRERGGRLIMILFKKNANTHKHTHRSPHHHTRAEQKTNDMTKERQKEKSTYTLETCEYMYKNNTYVE